MNKDKEQIKGYFDLIGYSVEENPKGELICLKGRSQINISFQDLTEVNDD